MIRGDNACALFSHCFKPFANSEEASLNSRWEGSQQAARRAAFSSTEQNSHFRHEVDGFPKPTPSPAEHPVLAQLFPALHHHPHP